MKEEYDDYTKKIKEEEQKLADYEDKWYKNVTTLDDFGKSIGSFGQYLYVHLQSCNSR